MCALCPMSTPGRPGTVTPVTARPGAASAAWYQTDGSVCGRCGSPASIATPSTARPLAAQALLSGYRCTRPSGSALISCNTEPAAIADCLAMTGSVAVMAGVGGPGAPAPAGWQAFVQPPLVVPEARGPLAMAGHATPAAAPAPGPLEAVPWVVLSAVDCA